MSTTVAQLRMGFTRFDTLVAPQPPPGYGLRTFRPGDEDAWVDLLSAGEFGMWDRPRLDRMIAGDRAPLPQAGIFFATVGEQLIGTACTFLYESERGGIAELGWVVVHPQHRGHGLGLQVCRAVLGFVRTLGCDYAYLLTEDFRLPAIKMYLALGFEPEMVDPSHPAWWAAIADATAASAVHSAGSCSA